MLILYEFGAEDNNSYPISVLTALVDAICVKIGDEVWDGELVVEWVHGVSFGLWLIYDLLSCLRVQLCMTSYVCVFVGCILALLFIVLLLILIIIISSVTIVMELLLYLTGMVWLRLLIIWG